MTHKEWEDTWNGIYNIWEQYPPQTHQEWWIGSCQPEGFRLTPSHGGLNGQVFGATWLLQYYLSGCMDGILLGVNLDNLTRTLRWREYA